MTMRIGSIVTISEKYDAVEKQKGAVDKIPTRLVSPVFMVDGQSFMYRGEQYIPLAVPNSCIRFDVPQQFVRRSSIKIDDKE